MGQALPGRRVRFLGRRRRRRQSLSLVDSEGHPVSTTLDHVWSHGSLSRSLTGSQQAPVASGSTSSDSYGGSGGRYSYYSVTSSACGTSLGSLSLSQSSVG